MEIKEIVKLLKKFKYFQVFYTSEGKEFSLLVNFDVRITFANCGYFSFCKTKDYKKAWVNIPYKYITGIREVVIPVNDVNRYFYDCAECHGVFEGDADQTKAKEEIKTNGWHDVPLSKMAEVCEDCYQKIIGNRDIEINQIAE